MKKEKYIVGDIMEFYFEELGRVNTMREVRKLCKTRVDETDGECYVVYRKLNEETNKYPRSTQEIVYY